MIHSRSQFHNVGGHKFGYCRIPQYNVTLVNWFLYGMVDDEDYDWFNWTDERPITFERRFDEVMVPLMKKEGLNDPDLIIEVTLVHHRVRKQLTQTILPDVVVLG